MLYALIEGLAGIQDQNVLFKKVRISPRWPAAGIDQAEAQIQYAASGASLGYAYTLNNDGLLLEVRAKNSDVNFHVLVPADKKIIGVYADQQRLKYQKIKIRRSSYVDFSAQVTGKSLVKISLK